MGQSKISGRGWQGQRSQSNTVRSCIFLWCVGGGPESIRCAALIVILISFEISPEGFQFQGFGSELVYFLPWLE